MTEREELEARATELRQRREELRAELARRAEGRREALQALVAERDEAKGRAELLRESLATYEAMLGELDERWETLSRDAAGARRHLVSLHNR